MAALTPFSWEECNRLTSSSDTLSKSVTTEPARWQVFIRSIANDASLYAQVLQDKEELQNRLDKALNQIQQGIGAQQGAQQVYLQQIQDLEERLRQA